MPECIWRFCVCREPELTGRAFIVTNPHGFRNPTFGDLSLRKQIAQCRCLMKSESKGTVVKKIPIAFLIAVALSAPLARALQVETIVVDSAWGGLGKPAHSTLLIHREDHHYLSDGKSISKERVTALLAAVGQPALPAPNPENLGLSKKWLQEHEEQAGDTQPTSTTRREQNSKRSFSSPLLLTNRRSNNDWTRFMAASIQTTIPTSR